MKIDIINTNGFLTCAVCGRYAASLSVVGRTVAQSQSAEVWSGSGTAPAKCAVHQQDVASHCMPSHCSQDPCDQQGGAEPHAHTLQVGSEALGTHHLLAATHQPQ